MSFIADFHIHSRYSRATSKNLCFETLYQYAKLRGVSLIGTGDFTHPAWLAEIKEKLVPDDKGLFKLKDENIPSLDVKLPSSDSGPIRFMITGEITQDLQTSLIILVIYVLMAVLYLVLIQEIYLKFYWRPLKMLS